LNFSVSISKIGAWTSSQTKSRSKNPDSVTYQHIQGDTAHSTKGVIVIDIVIAVPIWKYAKQWITSFTSVISATDVVHIATLVSHGQLLGSEADRDNRVENEKTATPEQQGSWKYVL
jgi:hypothetical protein